MKKFKTLKQIVDDVETMEEKDLKRRVIEVLHFCWNNYKDKDGKEKIGQCLASCDSYGHDPNCPYIILMDITGHLTGITDGVDFFNDDIELKDEIKEKLNTLI